MSKIVSASILSADLSCVSEEINKLTLAGADYIHFDVMDGVFVNNITFGAPLIKSARKHTKSTFDVHLMIDQPLKYIQDFACAGSDIITFHYEASSGVEQVIEMIKKHKKRVGISIKPNTPLDRVKPYLDSVDLLLIMLVEPGFGGQAVLEDQFNKVEEAVNYIKENRLNVLVSVDGGVNNTNSGKLRNMGVDIIVSGSFITRSDNYKRQINLLR